MDKIRFRDLQRWCYGDIEKTLPVAVTHDSQAKMVILTTSHYNKLVQNDRNSYDSQARPRPYNPAIHKPGDLVLMPKGKRMIEAVVPCLDGDGNVVYEEG